MTNAILEILSEAPYFLDGLNMTKATAKLKAHGVVSTRAKMTELFIALIPSEGLQLTAAGTSLYLNTPEDHKQLLLPGTPQYFFQVM